MAEWYYTQNGQQMGPISGSQLKALAASGGLTREDLVWNQSLPEWAPAGRVRGLVFGAAAGGVAEAPVTVTAAEPAPVAVEPSAEAHYEQAAAPAVSAVPLAYQSQTGEGIAVTPRTVDLLRQTKPWVTLFSVLMFIASGIMILAGILLTFLSAGVAHRARGGAVAGIFVMIVYIALGVLYAVPALFLWRYGSRIARLTQSGESRDLESALDAQRAFWRFVGIFTVVVIAIYLVVGALALALHR